MTEKTLERVAGYCQKCGTMRKFEGDVQDMGSCRVAKGNCPTCGEQMHRVLSRKENV